MAGRSWGGRRAAAASNWAGEGRQLLMSTSHRRTPLSSSVIPHPQDRERKNRERRGAEEAGGTDGVDDGDGARLLRDRSPAGGPPVGFAGRTAPPWSRRPSVPRATPFGLICVENICGLQLSSDSPIGPLSSSEHAH